MKVKPITTKMCGLCLRDIDITKDNYCHLEDFKDGKFYMEGYYHTQCYNDKIKGNAEMNTMKRRAMNLLNVAEKMLGEDKTEVITINGK